MVRQTITEAAPPLLAVEDFSVSYATRAGDVPAVTGVSLEIGQGESLGLVGESGCGKSTLAYGVMHHLVPSARITGGRVRFAGQDLAGLSAAEMRAVWARDLAMVFQEPGASLNPVLTIGRQLMETPRVLEGLGMVEARRRALELLAEVHLPDPEAMLARFPHQLSGGQQQRVVIAMALIRQPRLLVMDEPTTGLDATIEASILELVNELRARRGMALLFISHNLGTVLRVCERVGVMYSGELVE